MLVLLGLVSKHGSEAEISRDLTNLEYVALAHIGRSGPLTAHSLRQAFASSTAGRYSGSAGAIYPLVKRLEKAGFVKSRADANGAQKKRLYSLCDKGKAAVRQWLWMLEPEGIFPDDPLRTRFQYIRMLTRIEQVKWLYDAEDALRQQSQKVKEEYQAADYDNEFDQYVLRGVLDVNKARRRWVVGARELLNRK